MCAWKLSNTDIVNDFMYSAKVLLYGLPMDACDPLDSGEEWSGVRMELIFKAISETTTWLLKSCKVPPFLQGISTRMAWLFELCSGGGGWGGKGIIIGWERAPTGWKTSGWSHLTCGGSVIGCGNLVGPMVTGEGIGICGGIDTVRSSGNEPLPPAGGLSGSSSGDVLFEQNSL